MSVFVDTSVWSLALRRGRPAACPEVEALSSCLSGRSPVFTTGLVLQELLQGFHGPSQWDAILKRFSALPSIVPEIRDHVEAAKLRNSIRRRGVQVGTIDALIAQLCIRHDLELLTADKDFNGVASHSTLRLYKAM